MNNKRNNLLALLTILALSREINASSPVTQPATRPSNTAVAVRILRLDSPDAGARAHAQNWAENIQSDSTESDDLARMRWAAADTLGVTAQETPNVLSFYFDSGELQVAVDLEHLDLNMGQKKLPEYKMLASEAADHVVETLKQLINESHNPAQIEQMIKRCGELQAQRDNLRKQIDDQEQMLRKQTGSIDVSPTTIRQLLFSLQTQQETVQIDLAAKQARRDALAEQIAELSAKLEKKIQDDPVANELEKVVDSQQAMLQLKQKAQQSGGVTDAEVKVAAGTVAEAKAKLLERREAATAAAGGDILADWNKEMMTLSVDLAELKARAKTIETRLDQFSSAGDFIDRSDQFQGRLAEVTKQLADLQKQRADAVAEFASQQVQVTLVKSSNEPAPTSAPSR